MPLSILLHLARGSEDENVALAERVVSAMLDTLQCTLVRMPTHNVPSALRDSESDEVLCIKHDGIDPAHIRALRWAAHHRFRAPADVQKQLRCDVFNLDESRVETGWKAARRKREKDGRKR